MDDINNGTIKRPDLCVFSPLAVRRSDKHFLALMIIDVAAFVIATFAIRITRFATPISHRKCRSQLSCGCYIFPSRSLFLL